MLKDFINFKHLGFPVKPIIQLTTLPAILTQMSICENPADVREI